jgi:putative ABC transport system substrate-binding protein
MKRREFITLAGGAAAAASPVAAWAQQANAGRRIAILSGTAENDREAQHNIEALLTGLQRLGWTDSRKLRIDIRWGEGNAKSLTTQAAELLALDPEVVLAVGGAATQGLVQAGAVIPIVFLLVPDPVGAGYVASLARPGGTITGFTNIEYGIAGKWLEMLKEIAPKVKRVGVVRDLAVPSGTAQLAAIQAVAAQLGVVVNAIGVRTGSEIEKGVTALAQEPDAGLIVTAGAATIVRREVLFTSAARARLPAIYPYRHFVADGGLLAYGPSMIEQFKLAAGYVDRILRGSKPEDLPVQAPTKYEVSINLKAAKALGLTVPPTLLARADEVIE